jgi:hypothetical protein
MLPSWSPRFGLAGGIAEQGLLGKGALMFS